MRRSFYIVRVELLILFWRTLFWRDFLFLYEKSEDLLTYFEMK